MPVRVGFLVRELVGQAGPHEVPAGLSPLADALFDNAEAHLAADVKLLADVQRLLDG